MMIFCYDVMMIFVISMTDAETCAQKRRKRHWLEIYQFCIKITTFRGTESASSGEKMSEIHVCGYGNNEYDIINYDGTA